MSDNGLRGANNEKYANKMSIKDKLLGIGINPRLGLYVSNLPHDWSLKGQEYKIVQKYLRLCRFCGIYVQ